MISRTAGSFLTGIILISVIFVMVRPGSSGPGLVTDISGGLAKLVQAATGGGSWSTGTSTSGSKS